MDAANAYPGRGRPRGASRRNAPAAALAAPLAPLALLLLPGLLPAQDRYFPRPSEWERRSAADVGMDPETLRAAVDFALAHESGFGRDGSVRASLEERLAGDVHGEIVGPLKDRSGPSGLVLRHGYIVAEWGDTDATDMTFSLTQSFLSSVAGLAWDRGLIALDRPVGRSLEGTTAASLFEEPHNRPITWHHLLTQTSEWRGELWGKPDAADRRRGADRRLHPPGTFWEYNDVRVNALAVALLHVWERPLPAVLEEHVMDPIGASDSWRWHGYDNSWTIVDGRRLRSVSGGGHWGGGVWMGARDLARFGLLYLRQGSWAGRQVLSSGWIRRATTPADVQPVYGYMWWLNRDRGEWPGLPESSYAALGMGTNAVWIDPDHDLVVVVRWIEGDALAGFLRRVVDAVRESPAERGAPVPPALDARPAPATP